MAYQYLWMGNQVHNTEQEILAMFLTLSDADKKRVRAAISKLIADRKAKKAQETATQLGNS
jgi:hypothetical protein